MHGLQNSYLLSGLPEKKFTDPCSSLSCAFYCGLGMTEHVLFKIKGQACQQQLALPASLHQFNSVGQLCPNLCDPWTATRQASLSITNSQSLLKLMSIRSVMASNHLVLCCPLTFNLSHQGLFQWVGSLHQVAKILEFQFQLQLQPFQWILRIDFL